MLVSEWSGTPSALHSCTLTHGDADGLLIGFLLRPSGGANRLTGIKIDWVPEICKSPARWRAKGSERRWL